MDPIQAPRPEDPYKTISRLPDGRLEAAQFSKTCDGCGGRMAHGKLTLIPKTKRWLCQQCAK
jgi:hypothetical protein